MREIPVGKSVVTFDLAVCHGAPRQWSDSLTSIEGEKGFQIKASSRIRNPFKLFYLLHQIRYKYTRLRFPQFEFNSHVQNVSLGDVLIILF